MKRITFSVLGVLLALSLLTTGCSLFGDDRPTPTGDELERRDALVQQAKAAYDDASRNPEQASLHYTTAYTYSLRALEIDKYDLGAQVLLGWSLLQLGIYADFMERDTNIPRDGARTVLNKVLEQSPNEFRARQGLSVINFREHFLYDTRRKHFDSARRKLESIKQQGLEYFDAQSAGDDNASELYDAVVSEWNLFEERYNTLWDSFRLEFFRVEYAEVAQLRTLSREEQNRYLIGARNEDEAKKMNQENEKRLVLKSVSMSLERFDRLLFEEEVDDLHTRCSIRQEYWERLSTKRIDDARLGFEDLLRTAPQYFWARRDLGLVHMTIASKALQRAVAEIREDDGSDFTDASALRESWEDRQTILFEDLPPKYASVVRRHFSAAADELKEFVKQEEEEVLRKEQVVGEVERQINAGGDKNVITQGWLDVYAEEVEGIYSERRTYRVYIILQLIDLYSNDTYGVRNEAQANSWVNSLEDTDSTNPLHHFVRGVVKHKFARYHARETSEIPKRITEIIEGVKREVINPAYRKRKVDERELLLDAQREFELYLERSSYNQDEARRSVSRERSLACARAIFRVDAELEALQQAPR